MCHGGIMRGFYGILTKGFDGILVDKLRLSFKESSYSIGEPCCGFEDVS